MQAPISLAQSIPTINDDPPAILQADIDEEEIIRDGYISTPS